MATQQLPGSKARSKALWPALRLQGRYVTEEAHETVSREPCTSPGCDLCLRVTTALSSCVRQIRSVKTDHTVGIPLKNAPPVQLHSSPRPPQSHLHTRRSLLPQPPSQTSLTTANDVAFLPTPPHASLSLTTHLTTQNTRGAMVGKYKVDLPSFERLALPQLRDSGEAGLLVIDEVGE